MKKHALTGFLTGLRLGFGIVAPARLRGVHAEAPAAFTLVSNALGLLGRSVSEFHEEVKDKRLAATGVERAEVEQLIADRAAARAAKEWSRADEIRDQLLDKQIVIMDTPDGIEWRVRLEASE